MWQINSKSRLPLMKKKPVCYKMMIKHTPLINSPKKSAHQLSLSSIHENFENDVDGTRGSPQNSNFFFYIIFNIQNIIPKKLCWTSITYLMIVKTSHIIFPLFYPTTHETRLVFMFSLISHSGDDSHTRCRLDDVHDRLMFDNKLFSGREFS